MTFGNETDFVGKDLHTISRLVIFINPKDDVYVNDIIVRPHPDQNVYIVRVVVDAVHEGKESTMIEVEHFAGQTHNLKFPDTVVIGNAYGEGKSDNADI